MQSELALADFVVADAALSIAFESFWTFAHSLVMFGNPSIHALAPHSKTGRQGVLSHEVNDLCFG